MNKKLRIVIIVVIAMVLALPLLNLVVGLPDNPLMKVEPQDPVAAQAVATISTKCAQCHSHEPSLPFYARFPVASGVIRHDVEEAGEHLDYLAELGRLDQVPASEVTLAKTEFAIRNGTMPPGKYVMMHWNHRLTDADRESLQAWIDESRVQHYAAPELPAELQKNVVRPVATTIEVDEKKAALGNTLFHDTRLSSDQTISCASCHDLAKGGTDQIRYSIGVGGAEGGINAPTVYNSGYQFLQFWDGRAADLQEQAAGPVTNPIEMAADWETVVSRLEADPELTRVFLESYPEGISRETVTHAIAEFERTLITPNSAFDRYLMGDEEALTADQKRGYELFTGYGCTNCHVGPALGGQSFEKMGVEGDYFGDRGDRTAADDGRFNVTSDDDDRGKFKVPTLRNVALTHPYLHDGSTSDLTEVVQIMAAYQLEREMSADDAALVSAFLSSLTGEYEGVLLQ
jgi:cytochrome c peroxidase